MHMYSAHYNMYVQNQVASLTSSYIYAKQKHPGCKKRRGQSEAAVIK